MTKPRRSLKAQNEHLRALLISATGYMLGFATRKRITKRDRADLRIEAQRLRELAGMHRMPEYAAHPDTGEVF